MAILRYFENQNFSLYVRYAHGEIAVDPDRNSVFEILDRRDWFTRFYTNALCYSANIAELMKAKKADIFVSVDAGTKKTFDFVKGKKCYHRVIENLLRYRESGNVIIKYIILPEVNDNPDDFEGFLRIADTLDARICVSYDGRQNRRRLSFDIKTQLEMFIRRANNRSERVIFTPQMFSAFDIEWITKELQRSNSND